MVVSLLGPMVMATGNHKKVVACKRTACMLPLVADTRS